MSTAQTPQTNRNSGCLSAEQGLYALLGQALNLCFWLVKKSRVGWHEVG